ncbi:serine palmitoyltransferase small subunit B isoform X1 [Carcharodon carcharias]|uniref:serine palmitoyltransferase small subunit B isoform X1 n=2 Tax=Carcharodon carcharias TaxID=13397 RepID=UPI001B7EE29C|nr:serine palmitoyltransferase small subunit B isoform X1 [Carcharodon carcharias]
MTKEGYLRSAQRVRDMDVKGVKETLSWLYYQYLLVTCSYVLEPWEQTVFNSVLFIIMAMVLYTAYVFIPIHVRLALEFFSGLAAGQPESTVAIMT